MKKCLVGIFLVLMINIVFISKAQNVPVTLSEPLNAAMQATGAEVDSYYIYAWEKLPKEFENIAIFMKIEKEILSQLGFSEDQYTIEVIENMEKIDVKARVELENKKIMITICNIIEPDNSKNITYLSVNYMEKSAEEDKLIQTKAKLKNIMQKFHSSPTISTCLKGYLDGKLRNDELSLRLQDGFDSIGATPIKKTDAKTYFSYVGFAPTIEERVIAGKDIVNLNMVMRYNEYDGRTYVIIGSPVISIEY
ncbi:MAG: hypothetical protein H6Q70_3027 [Firmicutes bacterium]|nr:hypothetical protein [Bacillota bacterium]